MSGAGPETGASGADSRAHIDTICDFVRSALEAVLPPETACRHFRESRLEFLRGVRAVIDHKIDRLSRKNQAGGTRVTVE
jgi:hypothetical protein